MRKRRLQPGRDGSIPSDHRRVGNAAVDGFVTWPPVEGHIAILSARKRKERVSFRTLFRPLYIPDT